jgi:pimeloyl-ACP methyl ester carboxylesterase
MGRTTAIGGTNVHYIDRGAGAPVVLPHGNGSMLEELDASGLIEQLAASHRVIALDRPGFGLSPRPVRRWSPEQEGERLVSLMRQLHIERPVIVAHSWSTLVALSVALEQPDAISGLVLISGYYYPTTRMDALVQGFVASPVGDLLLHTLWPLIAKLSAPLAFKKVFDPSRPSAEFLSRYSLPMATRPSQLRALAVDTAAMPQATARLSKRYRELLLPVDLIIGTSDRVVTASHHSRRLNRELHNSFLDVVNGAGHMVHHAHPNLVARRVAHVFERALQPVAAGAP